MELEAAQKLADRLGRMAKTIGDKPCTCFKRLIRILGEKPLAKQINESFTVGNHDYTIRSKEPIQTSLEFVTLMVKCEPRLLASSNLASSKIFRNMSRIWY